MSQPGRLVPAQSKEPRKPLYPTDLLWHFREKLKISEIDDVLCRTIRQRQVPWSATLALSYFSSGPPSLGRPPDGVEDRTFPEDTRQEREGHLGPPGMRLVRAGFGAFDLSS